MEAPILTRADAAFGRSIEPLIRPLVFGFVDGYDWITYTSCQGHEATPTAIGREPHLGFAPRTIAEYERAHRILTEWAGRANARCNAPHFSVVDATVTTSEGVRSAIDVLVTGTNGESRARRDVLAHGMDAFLESIVVDDTARTRLAVQLGALARHGAAALPHGRSTLLSHLFGTYCVLAAWGRPRTECEAGLFHAAFGTTTFKHAICDAASPVLRDVVGESAEQLVREYATRDAQRLLYDLRRLCVDRLSGTRDSSGAFAGRTTTLANMIAANAVDQCYWTGEKIRRTELAELVYVVLDDESADEWADLWCDDAVDG